MVQSVVHHDGRGHDLSVQTCVALSRSDGHGAVYRWSLGAIHLCVRQHPERRCIPMPGFILSEKPC